jgi:hypothetical protein
MFSMAYKIDKSVPYPSKFPKRNYTKDYPLDKMNIGDSFLVPFTKSRPYTRARLMGMEISCRTETKGVRIWRIK